MNGQGAGLYEAFDIIDDDSVADIRHVEIDNPERIYDISEKILSCWIRCGFDMHDSMHESKTINKKEMEWEYVRKMGSDQD